MGIHNKELVANKPESWELAVEPEVETLPEVPAAVLRRAFQHLSPSERDGALRQRLVPVAWLPNITLYADGNEATTTQQAPTRKKVIARVAPKAFEAAVRRWLGPVVTQRACNELKQIHPNFSASQRFSFLQKLWAWGLLAGLILVGPLVPVTYFLDAGCLILTVLFACMVWLRLLAIGEHVAPYKVRPKKNDVGLPVYTVLVPVFRETRVLTQLIGALRRLNYPRDKLDIKLILEETDAPMLRKVSGLQLPSYMEVIVVPASHPQTKPKALNYALSFARGTLLTIYDAEDIPEPMQLRMAAAGFAHFPSEVACLQAELTFYNPTENWLTRGIMAQTPQAV
ncbi:MAG: glycosyltransferase [Aestuariivirga sp.]